MKVLCVPTLLAFCSCAQAALPPPAQNANVAQHEQKAQQYLRARQPDLARKEFQAVVTADPKNLDAQANLGVLLYFAGNLQDAEPHLRAALAIDPRLSKLQALLGLCEHRNGEAANARADLSAAFPSLDDPKIRKQAGLELVELDSTAGDLPAAASAIAQLKAAAPTDPEILYAAYRVYTDLAGEAMLDLSLAAPDSPQMHQAIAHELLQQRENTKAIANLRAALAADPSLPGAHFELAEILQAASDAASKAEAEQQYRLALEQNPKDDKTLTRLGDLAAEKGDPTAAMTSYKEALALQPENADAEIGLAHELTEVGQLNAALPLLLTVLKADPSNLLAHYRLSVVYRRLHRPEDMKKEVAEYERLKAMKQQLRTIYDTLRRNTPQADEARE